jgi:hypothetical protein
MAESPLIEKCRGRERLVFHFDVLPLWEQKAEDYLEAYAVMMYALLPTMQGANEELLQEAIDEMVEYYRDDITKLSNELLWMGILLERTTIVSLKDKERIAARLSMYDHLLESSSKIKKIRAESEAKGRVEGRVEGQTEELREAIVSFVKARFPSLVPLAQKRVAQLKKPATLRSLRESVYVAPDEAAMRALLMKNDTLH